MRTPTVHLNGTGREELLQRYLAAADAVEAALVRLMETTPHPRDYYVQDDQAWRLAMVEHQERVHALMQVKRELEGLYLSVDGQD